MKNKIYLGIFITCLLITIAIIFNLESKYTVYNDDIVRDNTISWDRALEIAKEWKLQTIAQSHNLNVTLILNDGTNYKTKEPQIDDFFKLQEVCGEPCKDIPIMTE